MALDECQPRLGDRDEFGEPASLRIRAATERTLRWAARCLAARRRPDQALFGIVQGGVSEPLRRSSARETASLGFDGYAHGGLGLGEGPDRRRDLIEAANAELPPDAPRYVMGLGRPVDLVDAIAAGVDLFDCVIPTRHARHGVLFTSRGLLRARNARFHDDSGPPDPNCDCPTCAQYPLAYLRHLLHVNEALGARLATLHNLRHYLRLLAEVRSAIAAGRFAALREGIAQLGETPVA
jgi:queuine tRNA-ribosyltransferase